MQNGTASISQKLIFDDRYSFDIFTEFPLSEAFPFQPGDLLQMEVFLVSHPVFDIIRQEISSTMVWYASVYPFGQPDISDPYGDKLLLLIRAADRPPLTWKFPWRAGHDDFLIAYLERKGPEQQLEQAIDNPGLIARLEMDLLDLTRLDTDIETNIQTWRLILKPAGVRQPGRIEGMIEWHPI